MSAAPGLFATTHWSVILAARGGDTPASAEALERLCRTYWRPIYAYLRRSGQNADQAADLTQEFFSTLLRRDFLRGVEHGKGRFRGFLLVCLRHFLADRRDREHAHKRGGGHPVVSLDQAEAERRYALEPVDDLTPEAVYEQHWVATLFEAAHGRLEAEYAASGRRELFGRLRQFPAFAQADIHFREAAAQFDMSEGALKSAVHRMRERYRELLAEEVAHTVADPAELKPEIRHLLDLLGR